MFDQCKAVMHPALHIPIILQCQTLLYPTLLNQAVYILLSQLQGRECRVATPIKEVVTPVVPPILDTLVVHPILATLVKEATQDIQTLDIPLKGDILPKVVILVKADIQVIQAREVTLVKEATLKEDTLTKVDIPIKEDTQDTTKVLETLKGNTLIKVTKTTATMELRALIPVQILWSTKSLVS